MRTVLKKLKMVEKYAINRPELFEEYIQFIRSLAIREDFYQELLANTLDNYQQKRLLEEEEISHRAENSRLEKLADQDLRRIRSFALAHHCLLYRDNSQKESRKLVVSESAHIRPRHH